VSNERRAASCMFYVARFDPQGLGSCKWAEPNGGRALPGISTMWALAPAVAVLVL
jgi:hypothetical protein